MRQVTPIHDENCRETERSTGSRPVRGGSSNYLIDLFRGQYPPVSFVVLRFLGKLPPLEEKKNRLASWDDGDSRKVTRANKNVNYEIQSAALDPPSRFIRLINLSRLSTKVLCTQREDRPRRKDSLRTRNPSFVRVALPSFIQSSYGVWLDDFFRLRITRRDTFVEDPGVSMSRSVETMTYEF